MASTYDFHTSADNATARDLVRRVAAEQGWELKETPNGGYVLSRGSMGVTLLIGALAGSRMHVSFDVQFFQNGDQIVVRLNRSLASGAFKGGAIGASRTAESFQELAHHLGTALQSAGVLQQTTEV